MRLLIIAFCLFCSTAVSGQSVNPAGSGTSINTESTVLGGGLIATLDIDRTKAYVNEQIVVTLQIGAPSIAFNITGEDLDLTNVDVVSLNHQQSTAEINGTPHQFTTTVYALFAREPGKLQIPALSFKAVLPVSAGGQKSGKGNPTITASTSAVDVLIEPEPKSDSIWFPAQNVEIESHWSVDIEDSNAIRAGEPITRHVSIKVAGQHPSAIPVLETNAIENIRAYPDLPRMDTQISITGLNGTLTQSYAIVASHQGDVSLPPIDIHWWNINDRQWQTTTLPGEQFQVAASTLPDARMGRSQSGRYQLALVGMAMIILGLTACCLILWRRNRRLWAETMPADSRLSSTERAAWATLQRDMRRKDFSAIRRSLVQWANLQWPGQSIRQLDQIPIQDEWVQACLSMLDENLYGGKPSAEANMELLNKKLHTERKAARKKGQLMIGLSVLYPSS